MSRIQAVEFEGARHWAKGGLETWRSIRTEGWRPSMYGVWGEGVYFAIDEPTADLYEDISWGEVCIQANVSLRKAIVLHIEWYDDLNNSLLKQYPYWCRKIGLTAADPFYLSGGRISQALGECGIQGIVVWEHPEPTAGPGGNQVCIFDTDCITDVRLVKAHHDHVDRMRQRAYSRRNPVYGPPMPTCMLEAMVRNLSPLWPHL